MRCSSRGAPGVPRKISFARSGVMGGAADAMFVSGAAALPAGLAEESAWVEAVSQRWQRNSDRAFPPIRRRTPHAALARGVGFGGSSWLCVV